MRWWQLVRVPDRAAEWSLVVPESPDVAYARVRRAAFHATRLEEWRHQSVVSALPVERGEPQVRARYDSGRLRGSRAGGTVMTVRFAAEADGGCRAWATFRQARWQDVGDSVLAWLVLAAVVGGGGVVVGLGAAGRAVPWWLLAVPSVAIVGSAVTAVQRAVQLAVAAPRIAEDVAALRYWLARSLHAPEAEDLRRR